MTDRIGEATSATRLLEAARAARAAGDLNAAAGLAREAAEAALAEADQNLEAEAATIGSGLMSATGDLAGAFAFADRALKIRQALNDPRRVASCLNNLGILYMRVGDYTQALECLKGAYDQLVECGEDARRLAAIVNNIGVICTRLGDYERAKVSLRDGLELARQAADRTLEVAALVSLGDAHLQSGELAEAETCLSGALAACDRPDLAATRASALVSLGLTYRRQGRAPEALATLGEALASADEPDVQAEALLALAGAHAEAGQPEEAGEAASRALELAAGCDEKRLMSEAHERLAEQARRREDTEGALHHYMEFHRLDRELFNEQSERRAQILAVQFDVDRTRRQSETYRARMSIAQKARDAAEAEVRVRTKELEAAQIEVVTRLAMAAEYRDDDTGQHTWRVGRMAALLAEALGYPEEQVDLMRLASRLHDVGKIGTPDAILLKPGKLSVPEYRAMASHATIGARILSGGHSKLLRLAEEIAWTHHERWDGRGYPRGLKGNAIPISGRIVAVADVFDALTSRRPYKRAWSREDALDELRRQSGKHFDPRVVEAALRVLNPENMERLEREAREELDGTNRWGELGAATTGADGQAALPDGERSADPFRDPLTGLGNAAAFDLDLEAELMRAVRVRYPVQVLSVELPRESRAEELEVALGRALRDHLRGAGRTYRLKDGTYAAIVSREPDDDPGDFERSVQAALTAVRAAGWPVSAVQVGLATFPLDRKSEDGLDELQGWSARFAAQRLLEVNAGGE